MENPCISVIVPVYKVEQHLDKCIQSIVQQTLSSLEILLVDDGSPDRCPEICDKWAARDSRIRVIHKDNGGLSDARNAGIEAACGEYIMFVDSDDYIAEQACERLLEYARSEEAELVCCNFFWDYGIRQVEENMKVDYLPRIFSADEATELFFRQKPLYLIVAWNKLYRRDLFYTDERIRFPVGRLHEDEFTAYRFLYASGKTVVISDPLYYYVQREGSIMARYGERNVCDTVAYAMGYIPWTRNAAPHLIRWAEYATIVSYTTLFIRCRHEPLLDEDAPVMRDFFEYVKRNTHCLFSRSDIGWKMKLKDVLLRVRLFPLFLSVMDWLKYIRGC